MTSRSFDVCVVGGGPAGSVAAIWLAERGYRVALIERERASRPPVGEAVAPSAISLLRHQHIDVERLGFHERAATVRWSPRFESVQATPINRLIIDRSVFDARLRTIACERGASVCLGGLAHVPERSREGWTIAVAGEEHSLVHARFLVDATGRRHVLPGGRTKLGPQTIALEAEWACPAELVNRTVVDVGPRGWFWGADRGNGHFVIMIFCDPPTRGAREARESSAQMYTSLLAESPLLRDQLRAEPVSAVRVHDATMYVDDSPVGDDYIRIGDAALALDPLSSTGIARALQSACAGAVVVNTILRRPSELTAAKRFVLNASATSVSQHLSWTRMFYSVVDDGGQPFWEARRRAAHEVQEAPRALAGNRHTSQRLVLSPEAKLQPVPCLVEEFVEERTALHHPSLPRPVAFAAGVPIESLLRSLSERPGGRTASELCEDWRGSVVAARSRELIEHLVQHSVLIPRE